MDSINLYVKNGKTIINDIDNFSLYKTLECGQAFRWNYKDGWYEGGFLNIPVKVRQTDTGIVFSLPLTKNDINKTIEYFSLDVNHLKLEDELSQIDNHVKKAVEFGCGLRLLRQPLWECIVSFIISARNSVTCIKTCVEKLCTNFGEKISMGSHTFYSFPQPEVLASTREEDIKSCGVAYRAKYIRETAKKVWDGCIDLDSLENLETKEAREQLMKLSGVGQKVADCILLFALQRYEVFPVDIWIQRVIQYLYFNKKPTSIVDILKFAGERFGSRAGYVQEYLYYYSRFDRNTTRRLKNM